MDRLKSAILAIFLKGWYGTFQPMHENWFFGSQRYIFEAVNNSPLWNLFIKCFWLPLSAYLSGYMWMNRIILKSVHAISKHISNLWSYAFLACLEWVSRNGMSIGHLDWDPSSVNALVVHWCYCAHLRGNKFMSVNTHYTWSYTCVHVHV